MIYIFYFILLLIGYSIKSKKKFFLSVCCIILGLIIGLRHIDCFPDTSGYVDDFNLIKKYDVCELFRYAFSEKEPLYILLSWVPSLISDEYPVYLLFWAIFPAVGLFYINKTENSNTKDYSIGFLIVYMLGLFAFFSTAIRQTAAMSILLFGYKYIKDLNFTNLKSNKYNIVKFFTIIFVAFMIHNSSIIFVVALFVRLIPFHSSYILVAFGAFVISRFVHLSQLSMLMSMFLGERFNHYGTTIESELSMSGYFIQLMIFTLCYIKRRELINSNKENEFLLNMTLCGVIFQSMTGVLGEMFRVSFYFNMFTIILVPRALFFYRKSNIGKTVEQVFVVACVIYLFFLSSSCLPEYSSSISIF